jgi:signal transduction histidine kinase
MEEHEQLARVLAALEKTNQVSQIAADEIARIVANLRHFVRLDEAEWQFADLHEGIDNVIALMEPEFSNRIEVMKEYGDVPAIHCSPSSLNQVFMSLLKNASEAIPGKGKICVRTSSHDEHVRVEISDTGKGIPRGDMDRIFDPGFTTKGVRVGVGLGLPICYKIVVNEHGGHIDVSSEPGKGTTFAITLPGRRDRRR